MAREETYSTTDVFLATNNFKTNEDLKNLRRKFGMNMFGKDKPSPTSKSDSKEEETGLRKLWTKRKQEKVQVFLHKKSFVYLTLPISEKISCSRQENQR